MALGLAYLRAIEAAGGLPLVIPPMPPEAVKPLVERLHGVCLSGGPDIAPAQLRRRSAPELGPDRAGARPLRAGSWRARRTRRNLPILAICRGAQLFNVATRRNADPAPARLHGRHRGAPPGGAARAGHARGRAWPRRARRRARSAGTDLRRSTPSTTRRSTGSARHCCAVGLVARRRGGGDRGARPRLRARRAVARRVPDRAPGADARCSRRWSRRPQRARVAAGGAGGMTLPSWARLVGRGLPDATTRVGIEEEVMLLDPQGWSLAQEIDRVLPALAPELGPHVTAETHRSALELATGVHTDVPGGDGRAGRPARGARARSCATLGLRAAASGTHPFAVWQEIACLRRRALPARLRLDARAGAPRADLRAPRPRRRRPTGGRDRAR